MPINRRYSIPLFLIVLLLGMSQSSCFTFRMSAHKQIRILEAASPLIPTINQFTLGKQRIQYTHIGQDSLPLVLFVHGSPGSSSGYLDYLQDTRLLENTQMIAVDRPGFGQSNFGKTEISLEKQAKAFLPILEKYKSNKTILVGHSFGGPVIAKMAMDFPHLVDGLVIVAGAIDPDLEPNEWWRKPLNWPVIRWLLPRSLRVCNQEILPLEGELRKMLPYWGKISAPVTVIQGEKDNLVTKGIAFWY